MESDEFFKELEENSCLFKNARSFSETEEKKFEFEDEDENYSYAYVNI